MPPKRPRPEAQSTRISYEQFGRAFFDYTVSTERISSVLAGVTGNEFRVGPMGVGPGGIVKAQADVAVGEAQLQRNLGTVIAYDIRIPLTIELTLNFAVDRVKYTVTGDIFLALQARAHTPLKISIDINSPTADDVVLHLQPESRPASAIKTLADVEGEMKRFIARYVGQEMTKPEIVAARTIDVAQQVDSAWP